MVILDYWKNKFDVCINDLNNINKKYDVDETHPTVRYYTSRHPFHVGWQCVYQRIKKDKLSKILHMSQKYNYNCLNDMWKLKKGINTKWKPDKYPKRDQVLQERKKKKNMINYTLNKIKISRMYQITGRICSIKPLII